MKTITRKNLFFTAVIFTAFFALSSCKSTFNTAHRRKIEAVSDCDKVQFYNSKYILLRREISESEAKTAGGKVEIVDGKIYQFFDIKAKTQGGSIDSEDGKNYLYVAFTEDDEKTLLFANNAHKNYPFVSVNSEQKYNFFKINDGFFSFMYQILPNALSTQLLKKKESKGKTMFGGKEFDVIFGTNAILLFKKTYKYTESATKERAKGRVVE